MFRLCCRLKSIRSFAGCCPECSWFFPIDWGCRGAILLYTKIVTRWSSRSLVWLSGLINWIEVPVVCVCTHTWNRAVNRGHWGLTWSLYTAKTEALELCANTGIIPENADISLIVWDRTTFLHCCKCDGSQQPSCRKGKCFEVWVPLNWTLSKILIIR